MLENPGLELELSQKETRFSLIAFEKRRNCANSVRIKSNIFHSICTLTLVKLMVQNRVPKIISVPRLKLDVGSKSTQLKIPPKLNCHFEPHHICDTFFNGLKMCKIYSPPNFPVILHPIKFERA